jgi:hypothetical protein
VLCARLKAEHGILMRPYDLREQQIRVVTHYWIKPEHIEQTLTAMQTIFSAVRRERLSAD